jgi:hypothetical protein
MVGEFTGSLTTSPEMAAVAALSVAVLFLMVLVLVGLYVYVSWAFMSIAKKVKYKSPGLAWIPLVGPSLIAAKTAKMHWWPILLLALFWVPILNIIAGLVWFVFFFIWMWKTFEAAKKPGWWQIFILINPVWYVLIGITAWSKK